MQTETRQCNKCKQDFILEEDDFLFYEKMKVPVPNVCPDCRFKMKAVWRNETSLYSGRKCDLCGKNIITMYNPKSSYKVYCGECYRSDKWDAKNYAQEYDLNRSFFEQLKELFIKVPKNNLFITLSSGSVINSDYINNAGGAKNCYFLFNGGPAEETFYSRGVLDCKEIYDAYFGVNIEECYEIVNVNKSSKVFYGQNVIGCVDCQFILNCSGLTNCFGCVNLRNKSNCWFNEQLTHEEYKEKLIEIMGSYSKLLEVYQKFKEFSIQFPYRENNNLKTIDSSGDYLLECKDVQNSFEVTKSENCRYLFSSKRIKDSIGIIGFGLQSELLLECVGTGYSSNVMASYCVDQCRDGGYSFSCFSSNKNIFGCDGLRNTEYCILNKQYTKEEYEKLKEHIINELTEQGIYGLMMPIELAPFAYNETIAQDNFPLTKEEAIAEGFRWEDDIQMTKGKETLQGDEIPDHIKDVKDSITSEILKCINCERNYKITEQELLFYRKMNLPIPRQCFYCRHHDRVNRRGPYKFWERKCDHCGKDIKTNYSPDRKEIIYCEHCYQQEVI